MAVEDLVAELEDARKATLLRFANIDPQRLEDPLHWRGKPSSLRFLLSWLSEGAEARNATIAAALEQNGHHRTDAQRAIVSLGAWRGRLRGQLIGLSDEAFDLEPAGGEWSVRRVLGHVIATDKRYEIAVRHAADRARRGGSGPMRPDESILPERTGEAESFGSPRELRDRLRAIRWSALQFLVTIPDALLAAPTNWVSWDLDVRFRIHRFASHDREHTIQIQKARQALGLHQTEPQLLLADAMVELGALEALLLCAGDGLLDNRLPGGGPSITILVSEALDEERTLASEG
ncbi:MAG TPA: DinB family protein [Dehalococcoidia bacterium]|nr:DinB family protein [Dehalococcoidia bacterium]